MELTIDQALQQGVEAHKAGQVQEADRLYTAILKAQPKHPDANHNLGVLAVSIGKVEQALPFFKTALEANPNTAQFWLSYIDALIKLDQISNAKTVLDQAKNMGAKGNKFDKLAKTLNVSTDAVVGTKDVAQDPPQKKLRPVLKLYSQGQLKEALDAASKLLKQFPTSLILYNISGSTNARLGQPDAAIEFFNKALTIKPDYAEAHNNIGNVLKDQGKLEEAIELYKKVITLKPSFVEAYYNMGLALKELARPTEAIEAYNKALTIKPDYANVHNNIGIALKEQGKLDEAIEAYNKALALRPDYPNAHNNMGMARRAQGNLDEAIEAYNKALALKPGYAEAYNNMGNALLEQGKLEEAIEAHNKALSIKPDYVECYWNLSGTSKNIGEAKNWLEQCIKHDPNHRRAKQTLSALQFYEGNKTEFNALMQSRWKDHSWMRSFAWAFELPELPELFFHRWALFDRMVELSKKARPFYEYGVWRGEAFQYLIKTFKKGYGFDTFEGIPEDWHDEKAGTYSSDGNIPQIEGGEFIVGKFEDTLPGFFSETRSMASIINFDADLYSSTICALNFSKPVIDKHTILIFDEFIMNETWEQDEYKALNEFCLNNNYTYEVLAISFFTKQVAVRLVSI